jgi:hypothetical protein
MCIIAPVSPIGRDDTRAQDKASDPHERERYQLPGIQIELRINRLERQKCQNSGFSHSLALQATPDHICSCPAAATGHG